MNTMNPIAWIRGSEGFKKTVTALTVSLFLFAFYSPSALAIKQAVEQPAQPQPRIEGRTDEEKLSNTLQAIKERVNERKTRLAQRVQQENNLWQDFLNLFGSSDLAAEDLDELLDLYGQVQELHQAALRNFDVIEQDLKQKKLPAEILQRHYDAVAKYKAEYQRFQEHLQRCQEAQSLQDQQAAMTGLDTFLQGQQFKRSQKPFDPEQLPFGTPDPKKTRQPVTDKKELNKLLGLAEPQPILEKMIDGVVSPAYAQTGNQPAAADLQPTIDVQITAAIQHKAAELNHNPIQIYNWVRNNIEFMPTYGSIQGSDMTLQTLRGNAFDTASLLIALLRASNIPARYAYGVVQIPADKAMNWVGGVEVPMAALSLFGQGGIPARGLSQGGQIKTIEMEHIWVEAWVDFEPSRGAKNNQGDSWIPLDASFKQYDYTNGIDIAQQVPFDAQGFANTIINSANIDETTGTVQNIDQQFIQTQLTQYQQQVENFINTQDPDMTVGEVVGTKTIRQINVPMLAAGLSYNVLTTGNRFASIPDNLRHKYQFQLQGPNGSFTRTLSLPELAGKTLALSFRPATPADEQTLQRYIPENITDISQLPQSLPGYLINLEAELVIDSQETLTGARMTMGSEVTLNQALYSPRSGWESTNTIVVAGEYHAIGVSGAGVGAVQLERLKNGAAQVQALLEDCSNNQNCDPLKRLTKHQITGNILQAGILGWFAMTQSQDRLNARMLDVANYSLPSYGKFGITAQVQYNWGIPKKISFPGVLMDIDYQKILAEANNADIERRVNFVKLSGSQGSTNEHLMPEQIFSTIGNPMHGVSAVKALSLAAADEQRIFHLTGANIAQLNGLMLDIDVRTEIRNAILAGKEVTVHERPVNAFGWSGTGYIIIDPSTGSGAYKISGGANGALLVIASQFLAALLGLVALIPAIGVFGPLLLLLAAFISLIVIIAVIASDDLHYSNLAFHTVRWFILILLLPFVAPAIAGGVAIAALASLFLSMIYAVAATKTD